MKKIALAVMLLTASSFGAVTLTAPSPVTSTLLAGDTITIPLTVGIDAAQNVSGMSIFVTTDAANAIQITGRSITNSVMSDPSVVTLPFTVPTTFDLATAKDLGSTAAPGAVAPVGDAAYATLTFKLLTNIPKDTKITIVGLYGDADTFENAPVVANPVVTITPEPISALLLGLGGLFFARRRRA